MISKVPHLDDCTKPNLQPLPTHMCDGDEEAQFTYQVTPIRMVCLAQHCKSYCQRVAITRSVLPVTLTRGFHPSSARSLSTLLWLHGPCRNAVTGPAAQAQSDGVSGVGIRK
jgi:hypothetical protein